MIDLSKNSSSNVGRVAAWMLIIVLLLIAGIFFFIDIRQDQAQEELVVETTSQLGFEYQDGTPTLESLQGSLPVNQAVESLDQIREASVGLPESEADATENQAQELVVGPKVLLEVPFTPQAPFGNWSDDRQDYGCEEASLLMAWHYIMDKPLSRQQALEEITAMSDWELATYGEFRDSSAADTVERFKKYFNYEQVRLEYGISIEDIQRELRAGHPVIVPLDGQLLGNPYYTPPGPLHHMMVVKGFDDDTQEFITNDPGTRRGESYRYAYEVFDQAIRGYDTGHNEPVTEIRKPMIVIE